MQIRKESSHELLSLYLDGDNSVSISDIKRKEQLERFNYYVKKFSFNKDWLKFAVLPLVFIVTIFFDSNS